MYFNHLTLRTLTGLLLCSALALSACKKATVQEATNTESDAMRVFAPESLKAQIQVADVVSFELSDTLRVAGQIDFDEQALTRIGASVTGRVTQIHAQLGNVVNKGLTIRANQASVKRHLPRLIEHVREGRIRPRELITHRFELRDISDAYRIFAGRLDNIIKPVLLPNG